MIGKIILGICIVVAVIIFVQPQYATPVFNFLVSILGMVLWICVGGIIAIVILIIIILLIIFVFD